MQVGRGMASFILISPTVWRQYTNHTDRQTHRTDNGLIAYGAPFYKRSPGNESKHSKIGPVSQDPIRELLGLFICVCIALCTIVARTIALNRPDNFPSYPPDNRYCSDDVSLTEK